MRRVQIKFTLFYARDRLRMTPKEAPHAVEPEAPLVVVVKVLKGASDPWAGLIRVQGSTHSRVDPSESAIGA